jgi:hypothetical protein
MSHTKSSSHDATVTSTPALLKTSAIIIASISSDPFAIGTRAVFLRVVPVADPDDIDAARSLVSLFSPPTTTKELLRRPFVVAEEEEDVRLEEDAEEKEQQREQQREATLMCACCCCLRVNRNEKRCR